MVLETFTLYAPKAYFNPEPPISGIPFYQMKLWRFLSDLGTTIVKTSNEQGFRLEHEIRDSEGTKTKIYLGVEKINDFCQDQEQHKKIGLGSHPLGPYVKSQIRLVAPRQGIEEHSEQLANSPWWIHALESSYKPEENKCMTPHGQFSLEGWLKFSKHKRPEQRVFK